MSFFHSLLLFALCFTLIHLPSSCSSPSSSHLTPLELFVAHSQIIDTFGRQRFFHGTNIVVKAPPYHPSLRTFDSQWSLCDEDMALLRDMGFSSLRVSLPWAAVVPSDGHVNTTYLSIMRQLIDRAGSQFGLYTVIDFHQDAWNAQFCGNGAPDWASPLPPPSLAFPLPVAPPVPVDNSSHHPNRSTCDGIRNNNWNWNYLTFATAAAVGDVYDNVEQLQDKLAYYWAAVAAAFSDCPHVIGYELMNEPFAGNFYSNPELLLPGVADREKLQPMYRKIADAIRRSDAVHLILFQGVTWEVVLPIGEEYGFTEVPGGAAWANKSVLSWHNSVLGKITPDDEYYSWKHSEMLRLGCGGWVTETGDSQLQLLDAWQLSWMHWGYKWFANLTWDNPGFFLTDGYNACSNRTSMAQCLDTSQLPRWSRTYAKAVAGLVSSFSFDDNSRVAVLNFTADTSIQAPTVIFFSRAFVYHGRNVLVQTEPVGLLTHVIDGDHVIVSPAAGAPKTFHATVIIAPSAPERG